MAYIAYTVPIQDLNLIEQHTDRFLLNFDKITIGSQTFETEQLAQLFKLLLKEHPELQI